MYTYNSKEIQFNEDTPEEVKRILVNEIHSKNRLRVFYGDSITGLDWNEEYDTMGYIGISTGDKPILLLINNSRSMGGGGILTHCVVKITKNKHVLYKHSNYHCKEFEIKKPVTPGYVNSVYRDSEFFAQFKQIGQAQRFIEFMLGYRNSK